MPHGIKLEHVFFIFMIVEKRNGEEYDSLQNFRVQWWPMRLTRVVWVQATTLPSQPQVPPPMP